MKAGSGDLTGPEAGWFAEYRFRRRIPLTHEQYLAESGESVQWMIRIDHLVRAWENEQAKAARQ